AVTFLLSAAFVSGINMKLTRAVAHPMLTGVLTPVIQGFRYVREHRRVLQMILLGSLFWGTAGVGISGVPAVVRDVLGGSIGDVVIFRGLIAVGLAVGAGVMSIVGPSMPLKLSIMTGLLASGFWVLALDGACLAFGHGPGALDPAHRPPLSLG